MTDTQLNEIGMLLTADGLDVLSEGLTGKEILFTRVALGDGLLSVETDDDYRTKVLNLSQMINWKFDLPIVEIKNRGDGQVLLHAMKDNADIVEGFFAREQAIFAKNPKSGKEVLYAYRNSGDKSSYIPGNLGPVTKVINLGLITVIQNAQNVNAILDASFAYTAQADFLEHVNSAHPHPNTPNHLADVTDADAFWVTNADSHLHNIPLENARDILFGSFDSDFSTFNSSLNTLSLTTNADIELGLSANVLLVEDFQPATEIDSFTCNVVSSARGGRLIGVDSDEGIVIGAHYRISDGIHDEIVQIVGAAFGTDYFHATLALPLTYDYFQPKLFRSTFISPLAADLKKLSWLPSETFKGYEANIERTVFLNTTNKNQNAIEIQGAGHCTADGYLTLDVDFEGDFSQSDGSDTAIGNSLTYEHVYDEEIQAIIDGSYFD